MSVDLKTNAVGSQASEGTSASDDETKTSLLTFPCDFPLKIMGKNVPDFVPTVCAVVQGFAPEFDPASVEIRPSSSGKYLGVTCTIVAVSQSQLDDVYRALTAHTLVSVVL